MYTGYFIVRFRNVSNEYLRMSELSPASLNVQIAR